MPNRERILRDGIETYVEEMKARGRSDLTIRDYRYALNRLLLALSDAGLKYNPKKIGQSELLYLKDEFLVCSPRSKKNQLDILIGYCKWAGNNEIGKLFISWGDTSRKNVRWLSREQAFLLDRLAVGMGTARVILHLEKDLGLRRVEVIRLKLSSFHFDGSGFGRVTIHGKGRNGGKYRTITCHPLTRDIIGLYIHGQRAKEVERAQQRNHECKIIDDLLIYANETDGSLHGYKKSAIDKFLMKLEDEAGFHFSNHDLRRTCGREMHFAGVKTERIAAILGHSDTRTTMKYLGLDLVDMEDDMNRYFAFQNTLPQKRGTFSEASEVNGQGGI